MPKLEELLRVSDALLERARRFSKGVGYEAGVSDTLEAVASLFRDLAHASYESIDRDVELGAAAAELRRIAAQLEIAAVQIEHLTRRALRWNERAAAQLDLPALDSAVRTLMETALRVDAFARGAERPASRPATTSARYDANYLAALALALTRAEPDALDQLVAQLRDAADHRSELLVEAAARLAHEHDTTEMAAALAIEVLERAAGLPTTPRLRG